MEGYLLDTHTLVWFLEGDSKLKKKFRQTITESSEKKYISIVSIWEIALKVSIGRLETDFSVEEIRLLIDRNGFLLMPIDHSHCLNIIDLPFHHKDPFDRMMIAQAITENLTFITQDQNILLYKEVTIL